MDQEEHRPHAFGYAHSSAILAGLEAYVKSRGSCIADGYAYLERPGEHASFDAMLDVARRGGRDILYVDPVKELFGRSLTDFKSALTAIQEAGMCLVSLSEPDYRYSDFIAVIEVVEDLLPVYKQGRQSIEAVALAKLETPEIEDVCKQTGLSAVAVHQAAADYIREWEWREQREQTEE